MAPLKCAPGVSLLSPIALFGFVISFTVCVYHCMFLSGIPVHLTHFLKFVMSVTAASVSFKSDAHVSFFSFDIHDWRFFKMGIC